MINAAELATGPTLTQPEIFRTYLGDEDSAVRYWSAIGVLRQGKAAVEICADALRVSLKDGAPNVRILAAEALARFGEATDLKPAMEVLLNDADETKGDQYIAIAAFNSLTEVGGVKLKPYRERIAALPKGQPKAHSKFATYIPRSIDYLMEISA